MPSIFPKNHLSKDPQTWNAFIGQMQLNMHAIKCMCCCSARSALSCSSDRFILRHHRSQAQRKWSRLLDGSPRGPLLSSFQSFSDKTLRLQEKKQPPCLEKQKSMLSNSRNNHFHLSVFKEGEGKGRQEEAGGQHYNIATLSKQFSSVQLLSRARLFITPWTAAHQASLSITNSQSLLKLMSIESVMPSNHLILCRPLLLLPSIFPSIRVFSNESVLHIKWPKYWSFSFNISPSNEYSRLISFRMDWFDLLAVQGTLKSLLQHHSSKASILWLSAFFIVQLSHPYMTTGKTIALTMDLCWQSNVSAF